MTTENEDSQASQAPDLFEGQAKKSPQKLKRAEMFKVMTFMNENREKMESLPIKEGAAFLKENGFPCPESVYASTRMDLEWRSLKLPPPGPTVEARVTSLEDRISRIEKHLGLEFADDHKSEAAAE